MSTAKFFMDNFGKHFCQPSGDDWADVGKVLRGSYPMVGKNSVSRMQSGWAIVRPGSATLQLNLDLSVVQKSRMTRFEAFAAELATWNGEEPRIFMLFDKAPISAQSIFVSVDKRLVRVCTNSGARTEDWTINPPKVKGVKN
jgi:hypothetical protein